MNPKILIRRNRDGHRLLHGWAWTCPSCHPRPHTAPTHAAALYYADHHTRLHRAGYLTRSAA